MNQPKRMDTIKLLLPLENIEQQDVIQYYITCESEEEIKAFISSNDKWVIEGCYTDLLKTVEQQSTEIIFMNLPIESCISNAKARPWEPHKYKTKQAQDENLAMLIDWIGQYSERNDTFSYAAHKQFYNSYHGHKKMITQNVPTEPS